MRFPLYVTNLDNASTGTPRQPAEAPCRPETQDAGYGPWQAREAINVGGGGGGGGRRGDGERVQKVF